MNRLHKYYQHIVLHDLVFKDHFLNFLELPQLSHLSFNTGLGLKAILDRKQLMSALLNMELVSCQRPIITRAKKSIDKFKLRSQMPVGCQVTLRKRSYYEFLDRFINVILPYADDSYVLFNHSSYRRFLVKHKDLSSLIFDTSSSSFSVSSDISYGVSKPYFISKARSNFFSQPVSTPLLRDKLWISNSSRDLSIHSFQWFPNKVMFSPKGISYFSLLTPSLSQTSSIEHSFFSVNSVAFSFLMTHFWHFSYLPSHVGSKIKHGRILGGHSTLSPLSSSSLHSSRYFFSSLSFGFQDFISSTSFGSVFGGDHLDVSSGFDVLFVIRFLKTKRILQPDYFFTGFQLPFWLS